MTEKTKKIDPKWMPQNNMSKTQRQMVWGSFGESFFVGNLKKKCKNIPFGRGGDPIRFQSLAPPLKGET